MKNHLPTLAIALIAGAISAGAVASLFSARADQSERVVPTSGIFTGPQYAQKIGDMARSVSTANKGAVAPANVGGSAVDGLEWLDDSVTPWVKRRYVNGGWAVEAAFDPATSAYIGVIGGGSGSIASASGPVIDLAAVPQANVAITGTSAIAGFGSASPVGVVKIVRFAAALTLTWSSALPVPCGYDLVTAAGDRAVVTHVGSGTWEFVSYQRASGVPVDCAAVGRIEFVMAESVPALHVAGYGQALSRASYPAYLARVTRAQSGVRVSGNATITGLANVKGLGASMPVEGTGINAGCTIASVGTNAITLNSGSCVTASGTSVVTVFLTGYGSGGSSSTVGVPDCRGHVLAGRDRDDPGSYADRLTTGYFGADSKVFGAVGGLESLALSLSQLPTGITSTNPSQPIAVSIPGPIPYTTGASIGLGISAPGSSNYSPTAANWQGWYTDLSKNNSISVTSSNTGGLPHRTVQPTLIAECVIRVTP